MAGFGSAKSYISYPVIKNSLGMVHRVAFPLFDFKYNSLRLLNAPFLRKVLIKQGVIVGINILLAVNRIAKWFQNLQLWFVAIGHSDGNVISILVALCK